MVDGPTDSRKTPTTTVNLKEPLVSIELTRIAGNCRILITVLESKIIYDMNNKALVQVKTPMCSATTTADYCEKE